jgi:hypothetical protein
VIHIYIFFCRFYEIFLTNLILSLGTGDVYTKDLYLLYDLKVWIDFNLLPSDCLGNSHIYIL